MGASQCIARLGPPPQKYKTTKEIYGADEYMTKLAETNVNIDAEDE